MKNLNDEVLYWLDFIKNKLSTMRIDAVDYFMNGNCGNLYTLLQSIFGDRVNVVPYRISYQGDPMHIVTKIGDRYYDINGEVSIVSYCEYLNTHNDMNFDEKDMTIKPVGEYEVRQQSNQYGWSNYDYDESYNKHLIRCQMDEIRNAISYEIKDRRRTIIEADGSLDVK